MIFRGHLIVNFSEKCIKFSWILLFLSLCIVHIGFSASWRWEMMVRFRCEPSTFHFSYVFLLSRQFHWEKEKSIFSLLWKDALLSICAFPSFGEKMRECEKKNINRRSLESLHQYCEIRRRWARFRVARLKDFFSWRKINFHHFIFFAHLLTTALVF